MNHDESDKILSHKNLLQRFGADETLADEMLNDQGILIDVSTALCTQLTKFIQWKFVIW